MKLFKPTAYQAALETLSLLIVIACIVNLAIIYPTLPTEPFSGLGDQGDAGGYIPRIFLLGILGVTIATYIATTVLLLIPQVRQTASSGIAVSPELRPAVEKETVNILCELKFFGMVLLAYMQHAVMKWPHANMTLYVLIFVLAMLLLAYRIIKIKRYRAEKKQP